MRERGERENLDERDLKETRKEAVAEQEKERVGRGRRRVRMCHGDLGKLG